MATRRRADPMGAMLMTFAALIYVESHPPMAYILMSYFGCMFLRIVFRIWRIPNTPLAIAQFIHIPLLIWLLTTGRI